MKLKQNTKLIIKKMKFNIYSRWYLFNYDIYIYIYIYIYNVALRIPAKNHVKGLRIIVIQLRFLRKLL